jgi:hypothetical protein
VHGIPTLCEPKRDEMIGSWRKLHNEELRNLGIPPNIIRMLKLRRMKGADHVVRMGRREMRTESWRERQKESDQYENVDVGGRIIL